MTDADITAREAELLGSPLRIAPLAPEDMDESARGVMHAVHAIPGILADVPLDIGDRPDTYFAIMARHPGLYRCQMETGVQLLAHGVIPPLERELAVLRTAWLAGAPYEWGEHVRIARPLGLTPEIAERLTLGSTAPGWSPHQVALLAAVEELVERRMISDATWAVLAASWDERALIELPALVGQYLAVALIQNSLRLPLNPYSRGLRER